MKQRKTKYETKAEQKLFNALKKHLTKDKKSVGDRTMNTNCSELSRRGAAQEEFSPEKTLWTIRHWNAGHECPFCKRDANKISMSLDHSTKFLVNSRTNPEAKHCYRELIPMCNQCNSSSATKSLSEFINLLPHRDELQVKLEEHKAKHQKFNKKATVWEDKKVIMDTMAINGLSGYIADKLTSDERDEVKTPNQTEIEKRMEVIKKELEELAKLAGAQTSKSYEKKFNK